MCRPTCVSIRRGVPKLKPDAGAPLPVRGLLGTSVAEKLHGLRAALDEIEQLIAAAERGGSPVDPWVEQVALELRATMVEDRADSASEVAGLIRSEPARSMGAQARLAATALRILKS